MNQKIKPCPFCGSEAKIFIKDSDPYGIDYSYKNVETYDVYCTNEDCYLESGADWCCTTKESVIEMWNKRI